MKTSSVSETKDDKKHTPDVVQLEPLIIPGYIQIGKDGVTYNPTAVMIPKIFKAKTAKGNSILTETFKEEWVVGHGVVYDTRTNEYYMILSESYYNDGAEWFIDDFTQIDITTLTVVPTE